LNVNRTPSISQGVEEEISGSAIPRSPTITAFPKDDPECILSRIESHMANATEFYQQLREMVKKYEAEKARAENAEIAASQYRQRLGEQEKQIQELRQELQIKKDLQRDLRGALRQFFNATND
jgi:murein L,D-transpeptidase YcbB/YkuD